MKLFKTKEEERILKLVEDGGVCKIANKRKHLYFVWYGADHSHGKIESWESKEAAVEFYYNSPFSKSANLEVFYLGTTGKNGWLTIDVSVTGLGMHGTTCRANQVIEEIF